MEICLLPCDDVICAADCIFADFVGGDATVALANAAAARVETTTFQSITLDKQLFDLSYGGALQIASVGLFSVKVLDEKLVGTAADDGCDFNQLGCFIV